MKTLAAAFAVSALVLFSLQVLSLASSFVEKKIANDSAIARDTERCADALEALLKIK